MVSETIAQALSLNDIVNVNVRALFRRFHLNRDYIIGFTGERGSGKSIGGATTTIRDFMIPGDPCWSNMHIKVNIPVSDEIAKFYGLEQGGTVTYESQYLEKSRFHSLDERYGQSCIFFDEFNIEASEARRSSSNNNLRTNNGVQLIRHLGEGGSGLVYTVINEMYVDLRVRENTDIFVKCYDVALKPENLKNKMKQGHVFEWLIFPMTAKVAGYGNTYHDTGKPIGPVQVVLGDMWKAYNTLEMPDDRKANYTNPEQLLPVEMTEDPVVVEEHNKWGWLDDALCRFYDRHANDGDVIEIKSSDLRKELGVEPNDWPYVIKKVRERLPEMEARGSGNIINPLRYRIPQRLLL